jgi:plasmid stabilization system protein ParE
MKPLSLAAEAIDELSEAAGWYESKRPGLASEFLDEIERILPLIQDRPRSFPRLLDPAPELEIRRAFLPRFPYAIVFIELRLEVRVLAVAHAKRRPGYWLHRIHK